MPRFSMRRLIVPSAVALVVAVLCVHPEAVDAVGSDAYSDSELDAEVMAEKAELEATQLRLSHRIAVKEHLITQLMGGQLTLESVAAEFLLINLESTGCMMAIRNHYAGASDEEKTARNVITFALDRAPSPEQKAELRARLECEFEQHYGHGPGTF